MDEQYWKEIEQAVGTGTRSLLWGTSTRSLRRSLEKLKAVTAVNNPHRHALDDIARVTDSQLRTHLERDHGFSGYREGWTLGRLHDYHTGWHDGFQAATWKDQET